MGILYVTYLNNNYTSNYASERARLVIMKISTHAVFHDYQASIEKNIGYPPLRKDVCSMEAAGEILLKLLTRK